MRAFRKASSKGPLWCVVICMLALSTSEETVVTPGCQRTQIESLASPNDAWIAETQEEICEGPGIATTGISDVVRLVRGGKKPEAGDDIFAIEEHGDPTNRPILQWLSPSELQVTVPNKSLIGLQKSVFDEIEIMVKFEPDDPAEREKWLRSLGLLTK